MKEIQRDPIYERAIEFAKHYMKEHDTVGFSNMYVIRRLDADGNVLGEYYGMNLMTDYGMQQYFIENGGANNFPQTIYFGNGVGAITVAENSLISQISNISSTLVSGTIMYDYPLYYAVETGLILASQDLSAEERRAALDVIIAETEHAFAEGYTVEVLTVDNHCDGPYLYLKRPSERVMSLLKLNGGNSSGVGIACISWDGTVYPDQFWRNHPVGNVRERPFSEIWGSPPRGSLLDQLRHKKDFVKGRCRSCRWLDVCGGNFRARGEAATGDIWGEDPSCYL